MLDNESRQSRETLAAKTDSATRAKRICLGTYPNSLTFREKPEFVLFSYMDCAGTNKNKLNFPPTGRSFAGGRAQDDTKGEDWAMFVGFNCCCACSKEADMLCFQQAKPTNASAFTLRLSSRARPTARDLLSRTDCNCSGFSSLRLVCFII